MEALERIEISDEEVKNDTTNAAVLFGEKGILDFSVAIETLTQKGLPNMSYRPPTGLF